MQRAYLRWLHTQGGPIGRALTHGHPSGYLSAGVLAVIVRQLWTGVDLPAAISTACEELRG